MNKKIFILFILLIVVKNITGLNKLAKNLVPQGEIITFDDVGKAEKKLSNFKKEKEELEKAELPFLEEIKKKKSYVKTEAENLASKAPLKADSFHTEKHNLLEEISQRVQDLEALHQKTKELIDNNIKILDDYTKDPSLKDYIQKYRKSDLYSYKNLLDLQEMIQSQKERISLLKEQRDNFQAELETREQMSKAISENLEKKKNELEKFSQDPEKTETSYSMFGFNQKQIFDLLKSEVHLLEVDQNLDIYKNKEIENKLRLTENKLLVANLELDIIKKRTDEIKIQIKETEITKDKVTLQEEKRNASSIKSKIRKDIDKKTRTYNFENEALKKLSTQYNIPIDIKIKRWQIESILKDSRPLEIGIKNENMALLNIQKELLESTIKKIEENLEQKKVLVDTKESFYKAINEKFSSEEEINEEITKYKNNKTEINRKITEFSDKINSAKDSLKIKKQALENIKKLQKKIAPKTRSIYIRPTNNNPITIGLKKAEISINNQITDLRKIIANYETTIEIVKKSEKPVALIISRLEPLVGKWYRPEYAIKWEELKNIPTELKTFANSLKTYLLTQASISGLLDTASLAFPRNINLISFIIKLLLFILLIFLFKIYAPTALQKVLSLSSNKKSVNFLTLSLAFTLEFLIKYLALISLWLITFISIRTIEIPNKNIIILYYLLSIPYLLYLANRCLKHLELFNKKHNFLSFIIPSYQRRLLKVIAIILYSTIIIQLFKKSFTIWMPFYQSELPAVLSALNWIIAQVALIFLITKELIQRVIPKNWKWLQARADTFYYIILTIAVIIIVMANPYIGFGKLLLYVIQRLLLSTILLISLFMLHKLIKKISLRIFFKTEDEEVVQARFTYGKPIYGLYVIITFILLVLIGILFASYIWNWNISIHSMYKWITGELFSTEIGAGKFKEITLLSFIQIFIFFISGFILSFLINKYVLKRIFDLLLVETGMQFAITSILKYVIVSTMLLIGFNKVGLGGTMVYLGGSIIAIGYLAKDPLSDFLYYFIILIQRPLKIGDYVKMEDGTQGVVRKITPRAIILKFRNSETKIVPNSKMLTSPITNWNYTSGFVAFNDMKLNIPYRYNPELVKNLIVEILDKHPNILKSPKPIVRLEDFGEYGFILLIRGFVSSHYTLDMWDIASDIRFGIIKTLKENNIEIAEPIRIIKSQNSTLQQK